VARIAADPELREVASGALVVLERIVKEASAMHKETKAAAADKEVRGKGGGVCLGGWVSGGFDHLGRSGFRGQAMPLGWTCECGDGHFD
jgi:hypothetical protein